MNRKEFLTRSVKMCAGGLLLGGVLESCMGSYYANVESDKKTVRIAKSEFIVMKGEEQKIRKYVLVRTEEMPFPVALYRLNESTYSALLMECTHNSCELNPHGDFLVCPCHGSEFNNVGVVQNPPAEHNLINYKVTHDEENIFIHLS